MSAVVARGEEKPHPTLAPTTETGEAVDRWRPAPSCPGRDGCCHLGHHCSRPQCLHILWMPRQQLGGGGSDGGLRGGGAWGSSVQSTLEEVSGQVPRGLPGFLWPLIPSCSALSCSLWDKRVRVHTPPVPLQPHDQCSQPQSRP